MTSLADAIDEALGAGLGPCVVGRWLATIDPEDRKKIEATAIPGRIETVRKVCATRFNDCGSAASWGKHFHNQCSCEAARV